MNLESRQSEEAGLKCPRENRQDISSGAEARVGLSVLFAGSCRFEPTCSQYAYQAIERFGVLRGVWLGSKRLARCHPFSGQFGFDPVPDRQVENFSDDSARELKINHAAANHALDRSAVMKDGIRL